MRMLTWLDTKPYGMGVAGAPFDGLGMSPISQTGTRRVAPFAGCTIAVNGNVRPKGLDGGVSG